MTWGVICGEGSHIDRHTGREIALGIVRRTRPWWNLREDVICSGKLQVVSDVMSREAVACGWNLAPWASGTHKLLTDVCELR